VRQHKREQYKEKRREEKRREEKRREEKRREEKERERGGGEEAVLLRQLYRDRLQTENKLDTGEDRTSQRRSKKIRAADRTNCQS